MIRILPQAVASKIAGLVPAGVTTVEPDVELAQNYGLNNSDLKAAEALIKEHCDEIRKAWTRHFAS